MEAVRCLLGSLLDENLLAMIQNRETAMTLVYAITDCPAPASFAANPTSPPLLAFKPSMCC